MFTKILNNIKIIIFVTVILIVMKSFIEFIYTIFIIYKFHDTSIVV